MRFNYVKNFSTFMSIVVLLLVGLLIALPTARADETQDLAKQAQNPVANLISLPFQNNTNFNVGPGEDTQNILNIQPVVPFRFTEKWNLVTRTIFPVIYQPELTPGYGSTFGWGDVNTTLFLSPATSGTVIWGAGPIFSFPTATDRVLGTGKYSAGPAAVALMMPGRWVFGALANNIWSYAGDGDRDSVNQFLLQYFINYNLPEGWYLSSAPIITANWEAGSGNKWTIPFGGGVGRIFKIGNQPMNASVQAFVNVDKPDQGPDWTLRLQLQFLFPK
jgi:hypothetical protein